MGKIGRTTAFLEKSCTSAPLLFAWYTRFYRSTVAREVALADVDSEDTVLNVGCGAMPFTATLIAKTTGATVYGLDHDATVTNEAQRNLERAGVADAVELVVGDGRDVPGDGTVLPEPCSVAFVALDAEPKDEILDCYRNTTDGPDRVVVRQPRPLVARDYDRVSPATDRTGAVNHRMPTFDRSLLFEP